MTHKLINLTDSALEIRLVKRTNANVTLRNDILPDGGVNNSTEFSFKLGSMAGYEHIVLAHADTPNVVNPGDYITNGELFTLTGNIDSPLRTVNASVRLTEADPNYATKKLGVFYKVRASDAIYVLGDKPNSPAPVTYRVVNGTNTTTMTISDIMATKGSYFADDDYYVPLFLGTLKDLEDNWLSGQTGKITFLPHTTIGSNSVTNEVALVKIIPVTGFAITNTEYMLTIGTNFTINTSVTPSNANVTSVTYTSTPETVAVVSNPAVGVVNVIGSGDFSVTAALLDSTGQRLESTKQFYGMLNLTPYSVQMVATNTARTATLVMNGTGTTQYTDVDWGDGTVETYSNVIGKTIQHTYANNGRYTAKFYISGQIDSLEHNPNGNEPNIVDSVVDWGNVVVRNFRFTGCESLTAVPITAPPNITSLEKMFNGCKIFNGNITGWYVGNITSLKAAFKGALAFNQAIGNWIVTNVTSFESAFENAVAFNQYINNWKTATATSMKNMFSGASKFNQDISSWNTARVNDFSGMFKLAVEFNQNISSWNTGAGVTFESMFQQAYAFDKAIGNWIVSKALNMKNMFSGDAMTDTWFNQDISAWDVAKVTNMDGFLAYNNRFNQDLRWWCVSNIATRPVNFTTDGVMPTQNEPYWGLCPNRDTVVTITGLPSYAIIGDSRTLGVSLNPDQPIQGVVWSVDNTDVINIDSSTGEVLFITEGTATISAAVNGLYSSSSTVTVNASLQPFTFNAIANGSVAITNPTTTALTVDWGDGTRVTSVDGSFTHTYTDGVAHSVKVSASSQDLPALVVAGDINAVTSWYGGNQPSIKFGDVNTPTSLVSIPATPPTGWDDAEYMFQNCTVFNQDISGWDVSAINSFRGMFKNAAAFNQNISGWNVSAANNMDEMFSGASKFNQDLVLWCVSGITVDPVNFATGATMFDSGYIPVWGTCPNRNLVTTIVAEKTTLGSGLKARLTYTTNPNLTVTDETWTVDDTTILSVTTRGLITGKTLGSTYVNLVLNKAYRARLRITVTEASFDAEAMVIEVTEPESTVTATFNTAAALPVTIDWGDGNLEEVNDSTAVTHTYAPDAFVDRAYVQVLPAAKSDVALTGDYTRILQWSSLGYSGLTLTSPNLVDVPSTEPPLLTDYSELFLNCISFDDDLSAWNTSNVTSLAGAFKGCIAFNGDIRAWDVGNVVNMNSLFQGCTSYNQSLGEWNTSKVTDFGNLFSGATRFNADIGSWDVSASLNMVGMFNGATAFAQDLSWWCVSNFTDTPTNFNTGAPLLTTNKLPIWGTCPNRDITLTLSIDNPLTVGGTSQLNYVFSSPVELKEYTITSSDENILTADEMSGVLSGVALGTAVVTLTVNRVYTATLSVTVVEGVTILAPTGLTLVNLVSPTNLSATLEIV